jgi:hypothetical protein
MSPGSIPPHPACSLLPHVSQHASQHSSRQDSQHAAPPVVGDQEAGALPPPLADALPYVRVPAHVQPVKAQVRLLQEEAAPAAPATPGRYKNVVTMLQGHQQVQY